MESDWFGNGPNGWRVSQLATMLTPETLYHVGVFVGTATTGDPVKTATLTTLALLPEQTDGKVPPRA